ncbi:hypothetical protein SAMN04487969_109209 [Paenibacillus algorifonticola]|uniref:Uncharacterized protein n=1 Tax=Paenibacillus algorifonticola TaxID=684063 RepID=A0A1I2ELZ6_9BACL|nr:hypothetical protein [Paenibacillus algorifonticola]SFE93733.1 hypothetical protein SAMN04487969_109209 [Paenibacillus algorifonticola]
MSSARWLGLTSRERVRGQRLTGVNGIVRLQSAAHEAIASFSVNQENVQGEFGWYHVSFILSSHVGREFFAFFMCFLIEI